MTDNFYGITKVGGKYQINFSGTMSKAEAKAERDQLNQVKPALAAGMDFDGGYGIGGLGRHAERPIIPTIEQMERVEQAEKRARRCRRCGDTDVFDGAMFTTAPSSGLCDEPTISIRTLGRLRNRSRRRTIESA
jgi:hypothetical protein